MKSWRWKLALFILIVVFIGGLIVFCPTGPYRPVSRRQTLVSEQELIVFLASMQVGRTRWAMKTDVWTFDVTTGELAQWTAFRGFDVSASSFYPPNDGLVFYFDLDEITIMDETGKTKTLSLPRGVISPNRELIAYESKRKPCELIVQEVNSSQIVGRAQPSSCIALITKVAWAPDSTHIAFVDDYYADYLPSKKAILYSVRPDGTKLTQLSPALTGGIYSLAWSPDSQQIAFGQAIETEEGEAQLWVVDITTGEPQTLLPPQRGKWAMYETLAWSPDAQQIAYTVDGMLGVKRADSLGIVNVTTEETSLVVDGTDRDYWYEIDALAWAPGDVPVILAALPEDDLLHCVEIRGSDEHISCSTNLYLIDPESGKLTQLTQRQFWYANSRQLTWWE